MNYCISFSTAFGGGKCKNIPVEIHSVFNGFTDDHINGCPLCPQSKVPNINGKFEEVENKK